MFVNSTSDSKDGLVKPPTEHPASLSLGCTKGGATLGCGICVGQTEPLGDSFLQGVTWGDTLPGLGS